MYTPEIQRALISVSDKMGVADLARGLVAAGVEIFSTGGTRAHLERENIAVRDLSTYTEFPEMMDGRLKTLHPRVFGGILCRHDRADDMAALVEHCILSFELVVVNLYPFEATVARADVTLDEAIEQIDIGGPSLVRAAAKNHAFVTIATNPTHYWPVLDQVASHGATSLELRQRLAGEAFARTAQYDQSIASHFARQHSDQLFPSTLSLNFRCKQVLRYGENPHQRGALYSAEFAPGAHVVAARKLHGKELSYNNLLDLDTALSIARVLPRCGAVVVKHNNPCGAASSESLADAAGKALDGDPVSSFGSVLGFNQIVDSDTAEILAQPGRFIEAIIAPNFDQRAVEILTTQPKWKDNVRLLQAGDLDAPGANMHLRYVGGGLLAQETDENEDSEGEWQVVTQHQPTEQQMDDLRLAWQLVRHVKSNAIVLVRDLALLGVGAGQMSRVDAVEIAINKSGGGTAGSLSGPDPSPGAAGGRDGTDTDAGPDSPLSPAGSGATGSVMASDAFFPFADSVHRAAEAGVVAIIQPGGSRRDSEVVAACNELDIAMVMTGRRHFRH